MGNLWYLSLLSALGNIEISIKRRTRYYTSAPAVRVKMSEKKTYQGNCHCAKFRFEVDLPEIESTTSCNCVACFKNGFLWAFPPEGDFRITRDDGLLTSSQHGGTLEHKVYNERLEREGSMGRERTDM